MRLSTAVQAVTAPEQQRVHPEAPRYSDAVIAYTILPLCLGLNFMLHDLSRLLTDHAKFVGHVNQYFAHTSLMQRAFLEPFATILPPVEAVLGCLLMVGAFLRGLLSWGGRPCAYGFFIPESNWRKR